MSILYSHVKGPKAMRDTDVNRLFNDWALYFERPEQ
jgi:hypothetical protein